MLVIPANIKQPQPGDLIEIFRSTYQHWAVYIGGGYVVHLVVDSVSSSGCTVPVPRGMGVVLKEKLEEVVGNDRWRINNSLDKKYRPQQVYAIVKQATGFIDTQLPYNVVTSNCEHFANDLRYGKAICRQVGERRLEQSLALIVSVA
ncbi:phospholipase A and acyltransferase 4-like [Fundulus diaphanus]